MPRGSLQPLVASDDAKASEGGAGVLARGGNAIDAAVATVLALGVTDPASSGIGGGGFAVGRIEDAPQIIDYFAFHFLPRHVRERIAHQMELAPLPVHACKASLPCLFEARMRIAGDQFHSMQATLQQRLEKLPPVNLCFA